MQFLTKSFGARLGHWSALCGPPAVIGLAAAVQLSNVNRQVFVPSGDAKYGEAVRAAAATFLEPLGFAVDDIHNQPTAMVPAERACAASARRQLSLLGAGGRN